MKADGLSDGDGLGDGRANWRYLGCQENCNHLPVIGLPFEKMSASHPIFFYTVRIKVSFSSVTLPNSTEDVFFLLKNEIVTRKYLK